jgi:hypothetical protein
MRLLGKTAPICLVLLGLILAVNVARLTRLDQSPPGFYIDEAVGALNVLCIQQTGSDYSGRPLPLFSKGVDGAYYTPTYLYGELLWTRIFGNSVTAFRSFPAFCTLLLIFGLFLLVRSRLRLIPALWVAAIASISPWGFQLSRIAWDPPLAPMFLVWGLYGLYARENRSILLCFLSGCLFALTAYAYPPFRVQIPLFLVLLPQLNWREKAFVGTLFLILLVPLLIQSLDPGFVMRAKILILWSLYPLNPHRDETLFPLLFTFLRQMAAHLTPQFLFMTGDSNLRHSVPSFGMLSYVDGLGWMATLGILFGFLIQWKKELVRQYLSCDEKRLLWIAVTGILAGIVPAALTWEGIPHSLRAIGSWPFFALFSGILISKLAGRRQWIAWGFAGASVAFATFYLFVYFGEYPKTALLWFQTDERPITQAYSMMTDRGLTCQQVR